MTYHTVGWFHIIYAFSRWAIVAYSTNGVSYPCMEVFRKVAFLAGTVIVKVGLGSGCSRGTAAALKVTGKAFSGKARIMALD